MKRHQFGLVALLLCPQLFASKRVNIVNMLCGEESPNVPFSCSRSPVLVLLIPVFALVILAWPVQRDEPVYCGDDPSASGEPSLRHDAPLSFDDYVAWADRIFVATIVDATCFDMLSGENAHRLSVHASLKGTYDGPITVTTTQRLPLNERFLLFLAGPLDGLYPDSHFRLLHPDLVIREEGGERLMANLIDVIAASPAVASVPDTARISTPPVSLSPTERESHSDYIAHVRITRLHRSNPFMTVADLAWIRSYKGELPGDVDVVSVVLLPPGLTVGDELLVYLRANSVLIVTDRKGSVIHREDPVAWELALLSLGTLSQ